WPFLVVDEATHEKIATNGIDDRWLGANEPSPLEKYMGVLDPASTSAARDWEAHNHGELVPNVASWFGHCPDWTASSMVNAPLKHGVSVKRDLSGRLLKCSPGDPGCTAFEIGDINALEAEVFLDNSGTFLGARCDTKPADIPRDQSGRILKAG